MSVERYAWWRALRESDLSPTARHVALTISTYMSRDGDGAWPSMQTLADDTGRSRSTVIRAIAELEEAGYLEIEHGGGRRNDGGYVSNRYRAVTPSGVTHDTPTARSGVTHDTPKPEGGVSSETGGVSSQQGGVSSETGSGVMGDTRTTHELPIQQPKQEAAPSTRAPDGAALSLDHLDDPPRADRHQQGHQYAELVEAGSITENDVASIADHLTPDERRDFLNGYRQAKAGAA